MTQSPVAFMNMRPMRERPRDTVADLSKIAERLLAHARLCRQIAERTPSEDVAADLGQLADDCTQLAAEVSAPAPVSLYTPVLRKPH
jgi:hypothetical protein